MTALGREQLERIELVVGQVRELLLKAGSRLEADREQLRALIAQGDPAWEDQLRVALKDYREALEACEPLFARLDWPTSS